jgi:hypothetical protein
MTDDLPTTEQREVFLKRLEAALLTQEDTESIAKRFGVNTRGLRRKRLDLAIKGLWHHARTRKR